MSNNPIYPGYPWEQQISIAPAALDPAADIRIALRRVRDPRGTILNSQTLRRDGPSLWSIVLPANATSSWSDGQVAGDLVAIEAGIARPIGVRLIIPVTTSLTPPTP